MISAGLGQRCFVKAASHIVFGTNCSTNLLSELKFIIKFIAANLIGLLFTLVNNHKPSSLFLCWFNHEWMVVSVF